MNLFNYAFYRISDIYIRTGVETQRPDMGGGAVVSLFQGFNIITLLYFLFSIKMTPYLWVFLWIPLIILNWIFFFNFKNLKKYKSKWDEEKKGKRQIKGVLIIGYMITSIIFFGMALSKMY